MLKSAQSGSLTKILLFLESKSVEYTFDGEALSSKITQVSSLSGARKEHVSFFSDPKRKQELQGSAAGVVIIKPDHADLTSLPKIIVKDPYYTYALVAQFLNPLPVSDFISEFAKIDSTANVAKDVFIADNVVIGKHVKIGEGVQISAGCVIEKNVIIGDFTHLLPNVTIMSDCCIGQRCMIQAGVVIGGEGFGFAPHSNQWQRIPQIGRVLIGNDVSIGNNTTIDRGTIEDTIIEDHCIIDNLVHIAHNVTISQGTAIAAQVGFAGGVKVGKNCVFAGQVGVAGHISLASGVSLMAKAGVTNSIKKQGSYSGFPAQPTIEWQKNTIRKRNLKKMVDQVKHLEKELSKLKSLDKLGKSDHE